MSLSDLLHDLIEEGRQMGAFSTAAIGVIHKQGLNLCLSQAFGGGAGPNSLWDLASLTKPIATATLALKAFAAGMILLDEAPFESSPHLTWEHLLSHRSGLEAWVDLGAVVPEALWGHSSAYPLISDYLAGCLKVARPRASPVYSDLGYLLLGEALAQRGVLLSTLAWGKEPNLGYQPPKAERARCVPMGYCAWRKYQLQGEVHDSNTWILGGMQGHAGLFATLEAVLGWATQVLECALGSEVAWPGVAPHHLHTFWQRPYPREGTWVCGWDSPSTGNSSAGAGVAPSARGHLGFTGTSIWFEPESQRATVILTDRVALGPEAQPLLRVFRSLAHERIRAFTQRQGLGDVVK